MTDLFIPAAPKDYKKIPYILGSVSNFVPDIQQVFIVTPDGHKFTGGGLVTTCLKDSDVLDFDRSAFRYRPNWVYQQMLKLFQRVTDDWYLVIDADRFFSRRVDFWEDGKPVLNLLSFDQRHDPYFEFNQRMLGFGKTYHHSFLSECTLYSRALILEMIADAGHDTPHEFLEAAAAVIDGGCYPAESELYGSWIYREHRHLYTFKTIKGVFGGKYDSGEYTETEIQEAIKHYSAEDVDVFSLHSWEGKV